MNIVFCVFRKDIRDDAPGAGELVEIFSDENLAKEYAAASIKVGGYLEGRVGFWQIKPYNVNDKPILARVSEEANIYNDLKRRTEGRS